MGLRLCHCDSVEESANARAKNVLARQPRRSLNEPWALIDCPGSVEFAYAAEATVASADLAVVCEPDPGQDAADSGETAYASTAQTIYLRDGLDPAVIVGPATIHNPKRPNVTIVGGSDSDVMTLDWGSDVVTVGSASKTVGGGSDTIAVTAPTRLFPT